MAAAKARCDYALFVGASSENFATIRDLAPQAAGLKMYLNETFTTLRLKDLTVWRKHMDAWPMKAPLCVHAEGQTTAAVLLLATFHNRPIHVCHVARKEEIQIIRAAKEKVRFRNCLFFHTMLEIIYKLMFYCVFFFLIFAGLACYL